MDFKKGIVEAKEFGKKNWKKIVVGAGVIGGAALLYKYGITQKLAYGATNNDKVRGWITPQVSPMGMSEKRILKVLGDNNVLADCIKAEKVATGAWGDFNNGEVVGKLSELGDLGKGIIEKSNGIHSEDTDVIGALIYLKDKVTED